MPIEQQGAVQAADFIADVREGLTRSGQKILRSRYLYDDVGSALFEVITLLPEYGLTRADERLLERHAGELAGMLDPGVVVAELGSGSGVKTRRILTEIARRGPIDYFPIDISTAALDRCRMELGSLEGVRVETVASAYLEGLRAAVGRAPERAQLLLLFLGSTIGNFDRGVALEFLKDLRRILRPGDVLFLGTDLEKPVGQLLAAYDDPTGVTAAFNLNILARLNRELEAEFDLGAFRHLAVYNSAERRIEMHLRSVRDQRVRIRAADLAVDFRKDETIWTESSHKFDPEEVVRMGEASGFRSAAQWVDADWLFAENVLVAV